MRLVSLLALVFSVHSSIANAGPSMTYAFPAYSTGVGGQFILNADSTLTIKNPTLNYRGIFYPLSGDGDSRATATGFCYLLGRPLAIAPTRITPPTRGMAWVLSYSGTALTFASASTTVISQFTCK